MDIKVGAIVQNANNPAQWGKVKDIFLADGTLQVVADPESAAATGVAVFSIHASQAEAHVKSGT